MNKLSVNKLSVIFASLVLACAPAFADKTAGESVDDTWLHTKVKTALVGHGSGDINIEVYRGEVQLAGFMTSETTKEEAITAARNVSGVKKILDQLHVVADSRSAGEVLDDNTLTTKVKATLADSDLGRGFQVNVEVNRGTVLLSGFVASDAERDKAVEVAKSVTGTKQVVNGMNIKPAAE
jgi:hyperosmotically inducible protein